MTKQKLLYISILLTVITIACSKIKYYDDNPISSNTTKVLSHRGVYFAPGYQQNTLKSAILGLKTLDGIELDIQISKDNTLWLGYDLEVYDCNGQIQCINELSDQDLTDMNLCPNTIKHSKLEKVFSYMKDSAPDKFISLDVKYPRCNGSITNEFKTIATEIVRLVKKYELHGKVLVESSKTSFLKDIKEKSKDIELYYLAYDDFDKGMAKALEGNFTGISLKFNGKVELTQEHIDLIHRKGLKVQMWTVNFVEDITEVYSIQPDYIQTDNLYFYYFLNAIPLPDSLLNWFNWLPTTEITYPI